MAVRMCSSERGVDHGSRRAYVVEQGNEDGNSFGIAFIKGIETNAKAGHSRRPLILSATVNMSVNFPTPTVGPQHAAK